MKSVLPTGGDNHYWGVWHEKHKFEEYEKNIGRFISEHGFQSFPEFETVRQYTLPEDYDIESEIMSAHQRSGIGNLRIREYMGWYYQVPEDFRANAVHEPGIASPGHANSHGNTSAAYALLYGIAGLAAERLLAGSQLVDNRLLPQLESGPVCATGSLQAGDISSPS